MAAPNAGAVGGHSAGDTPARLFKLFCDHAVRRTPLHIHVLTSATSPQPVPDGLTTVGKTLPAVLLLCLQQPYQLRRFVFCCSGHFSNIPLSILSPLIRALAVCSAVRLTSALGRFTSQRPTIQLSRSYLQDDQSLARKRPARVPATAFPGRLAMAAACTTEQLHGAMLLA